jgi:hypothetical protein
MADTVDKSPEDSIFRAINTSAHDSSIGSSPLPAQPQFDQLEERIILMPPPALSTTSDFGNARANFEVSPFGFVDTNHLKACTASAVDDIAESDFKSGGDYLNEFRHEELENHKSYANNDLTINKSSSNEWWTNASQMNQASFIQLSDVSPLQNNTVRETPAVTRQVEKKSSCVNASDYFNKILVAYNFEIKKQYT